MLDNVYLQIFDFLPHKYLVIDVNHIYVHNVQTRLSSIDIIDIERSYASRIVSPVQT